MEVKTGKFEPKFFGKGIFQNPRNKRAKNRG